MKKVLFVATVVKHHIMSFHIPYIEWFKQNGYETHVCARNDYENKEDCVIPYCDKYYDLPFGRSPFNLSNITAYNQLKKIIDSNEYNIIHCHTPVGGVLTRLAAKKTRKNGTKIIYTAHGFHFFKGAPLKNWILFYPVEGWLARYTDVLITINKEDYQRAQEFKAKKVEYVPGIGIDTDKFKQDRTDRAKKLNELKIPLDSIVLLSVGELTKGKNHEVVIRAISKIKNPKIKYIICGQGQLNEYLHKLAVKLKMEDQVIFLGFRRDIPEICNISDIFVFPSFREGLPVSLMEAMATGLPVVCSDIRGNTDLIEDGKGGYLVEPENIEDFANAIKELFESEKLRVDLGKNNLEEIKKYSISYVMEKMEHVYKMKI